MRLGRQLAGRSSGSGAGGQGQPVQPVAADEQPLLAVAEKLRCPVDEAAVAKLEQVRPALARTGVHLEAQVAVIGPAALAFGCLGDVDAGQPGESRRDYRQNLTCRLVQPRHRDFYLVEAERAAPGGPDTEPLCPEPPLRL